MVKKVFILLLCTLLAADILGANSTTNHLDSLAFKVENGDTLFLAFLHDVYVFPKMKFKSKKQERFYWKTVRDVKKTLPVAKQLAREMEKTDDIMSKMDRAHQRKFWKKYEKLLFQEYEGEFRTWTASQGRMLMILIDRETSFTSYQVIQHFKGTLTANFWQGIAKLVGNDLKEEYDGADKDKIVERVILLVEAGQL